MLGLVPQSLALYPTLSAAQNVWHFARMQGLSHDEAATNCTRVLEEAGLADRANDPMHSFSGGMKRLLNLACGIVHRLYAAPVRLPHPSSLDKLGMRKLRMRILVG